MRLFPVLTAATAIRIAARMNRFPSLVILNRIPYPDDSDRHRDSVQQLADDYLGVREKFFGLQNEPVTQHKRSEGLDVIRYYVISAFVIGMCLCRLQEELSAPGADPEPDLFMSAGLCYDRHQVIQHTIVSGNPVGIGLHCYDFPLRHYMNDFIKEVKTCLTPDREPLVLGSGIFRA